jgi:hypothetical protein
MAFTYRLSRRLALTHLALLTLLVLSCSDAQAPSHEASVNTSSDTNPEVQPVSFSTVTTGNPNEPAGFVAINTRAFNQKVESGWRTRTDPEFSIIQSSAAPESPNGVGKAFFPIGLKGGNGPTSTWYVFPSPRNNLYVSFWIKLSSNWKGHFSNSNKVLNFWIDGNNRVVLKVRGAYSKPLWVNVKMQNVAMSPAAYDLDPNQAAKGSIIRGQWHHIEYVLRANTASNYNGSMTWWVDGAMAGSHSNLRFVSGTQKHQWTQVVWNPVWGGAGDILDQNQDMQIDHVYISGS